MKRILLLVVTNLAVVVLLLVIASLLGIDRFLTAQGLNLGSLLVFSALIGFGGAFFSLAISKLMAKKSTGAQVIVEPRDRAEAWLLETVARQAEAAGIARPEVAIYDSPEPNAFAISGGVAEGLKRLFLSHPPLEERIAALRAAPAPSQTGFFTRGVQQ